MGSISKSFLFLSLLAAPVLLISSEVAARDLAETTTEKKNGEAATETTKAELEGSKYGYGGYGGHEGHGGYGGHEGRGGYGGGHEGHEGHGGHSGYGGGHEGHEGHGGHGGYGGGHESHEGHGGHGGYGGGHEGHEGHGGHGGYGGGRGGYRGGCAYDCCRSDYYGRGCQRCCSYAGDAVDAETHADPHN